MAGYKWNNKMYVKAYQLALDGMPDQQIARAIGVTRQSFLTWRKKDPALRDALAQARDQVKGEDGAATFSDYVYRRLSPEAQDVLADIKKIGDAKNALAKIDAIFEKQGKRIRQYLFVHAFFGSNFDISMACTFVGISRMTFYRWTEESGFAEIMDDMMAGMGDLFQNHLVQRVKAGDTAAIIFANKTFNKDRGYGEQVEHKHIHHHVHDYRVTLDKLDLPDEVFEMILDAVRKQKAVEMKGEDGRFLPLPSNGNGNGRWKR